MEVDILRSHKERNHRIEPKEPEEQLRMVPIYQHSKEQGGVWKEYLDNMIQEGKIRPLHNPAGTRMGIVPNCSSESLCF